MIAVKETGWSRFETIILVVIVAVLVWIAWWPRRIANKVHIGMTDAEAIAAVGRGPDRQEGVLSFCRKDSKWYGDCSAVLASRSVAFMLWKVGIDSWLVVGVDADHKVKVVVVGDT
jgi:hypothetical protein